MFDVHQRVFSEDGERDEDKVQDYIDGLVGEFAASPEAKPLLDSEDGIGWTGMFLEYGLNYPGSTPPDMSPGDFEEIVFELFPRKVSMEPERAGSVVTELRAFWQFLRRQYGLRNADRILAKLDASATGRLRDLLADPSNYGMAKSFFMLGKRAGFDMTTQEGLDQWMLAYNSQLAANQVPLPPLADEESIWPALPPSPLSPREKADKRKARKRQRQARKRNRKK